MCAYHPFRTEQRHRQRARARASPLSQPGATAEHLGTASQERRNSPSRRTPSAGRARPRARLCRCCGWRGASGAGPSGARGGPADAGRDGGGEGGPGARAPSLSLGAASRVRAPPSLLMPPCFFACLLNAGNPHSPPVALPAAACAAGYALGRVAGPRVCLPRSSAVRGATPLTAQRFPPLAIERVALRRPCRAAQGKWVDPQPPRMLASLEHSTGLQLPCVAGGLRPLREAAASFLVRRHGPHPPTSRGVSAVLASACVCGASGKKTAFSF